MAVTKLWKVYGEEQDETYEPSVGFVEDSSRTREVLLINRDITQTTDYAIVRVTRDTEEECVSELKEQLSDGTFKGCDVGRTEEICEQDIPKEWIIAALNRREWYAVMRNNEDDWCTGSFKKSEAISMLESDDEYTMIAVIKSNTCTEEIHRSEVL